MAGIICLFRASPVHDVESFDFGLASEFSRGLNSELYRAPLIGGPQVL